MGGRGRARGLLDGGAPFYDLYQTSDGRHLAVGALEPQFYDELLQRLGLTGQVPDRNDPTTYAELRAALSCRIAERTLAEWAEVFDGSDACVAPVLTLEEAAAHPHLAARRTFTEVDGLLQPNPAPHFSRTPARLTTPPDVAGAHTREALLAWGVEHVDALLASGAAVQA
jgi:alpha-methylacyl-CoA racemase